MVWGVGLSRWFVSTQKNISSSAIKSTRTNQSSDNLLWSPYLPKKESNSRSAVHASVAALVARAVVGGVSGFDGHF